MQVVVPHTQILTSCHIVKIPLKWNRFSLFPSMWVHVCVRRITANNSQAGFFPRTFFLEGCLRDPQTVWVCRFSSGFIVSWLNWIRHRWVSHHLFFKSACFYSHSPTLLVISTSEPSVRKKVRDLHVLCLISQNIATRLDGIQIS